MRKIIVAALMMAAVLPVSAQELPMPSPTATLKQRVGLTDITIVYSRPSMKDREIFGELVPYNEMWRTGANMNTTLEVSTDIMVNGKPLKAGKYSLFTIPSEDTWVIILNSKNDHSGTSGYSEDADFLRTKVEATEACETETFTIDINDIRSESASLVLRWAETEVKVPFTVEVAERAMANIEAALNDTEEDAKWRVYRNAANYYYNNKIELDQALDYVDRSIAANQTQWYSYWLKAEILAEKKMYKEAIKMGEKAKDVGMKSAKTDGTEFGYAKMIDSEIEAWKAMK